MKALRSLRLLSRVERRRLPFSFFPLDRSYSVDPQSHSETIPSTSDDDYVGGADSAVFDSRDFDLPDQSATATAVRDPSWSRAYRKKADGVLFGKQQSEHHENEEEDEGDERKRALARVLLEMALSPPDDVEEGDMVVKEEDQRSLSVGIVGAPNAGKSSLTNFMVGTKVAAVSRKTNTTTHEVLGVMTKGSTQVCFFDTPGLMIGHHGYPYRTDVRVRLESAWSSLDLYDLLIVIFDVHRHLTTPDTRVTKLIKRLGAEAHPSQKRVLCMNKVDLVEDKKNLLKVSDEFKDLPGYERYFMLSGLKGSGVKDLVHYLIEQGIKRPWDQVPKSLSEESMKNTALEVVREKLLDHVHQEIPYVVEHQLMDWKELRDGSLRIEQHFITPKESQRQILVGKKGAKIGRIGVEANEELRRIFNREVHLILTVRVTKKKNA